MPTRLLACCLASLLAAALAPSVSGRTYRNPTAGAELAYQIPGMHRAKVLRDRVYSRAGGSPLLMDVYRPRTAPTGKRLPVVVLGGPPAYRAGRTSGQKVGWAQAISASGVAAAAFDIRSDNFLRTPYQPSRDVAAAMQYLRAHAASLGIDPGRMCTLGFSLGTAPWHLWAAMRPNPPYVKCNVVYYGPLDFEGFDDVPMEAKYVAEFSAITYLRKYGAAIAPMLVAEAGLDRFQDINTSIDRFQAEAVQRGAAGHGRQARRGAARVRHEPSRRALARDHQADAGVLPRELHALSASATAARMRAA